MVRRRLRLTLSRSDTRSAMKIDKLIVCKDAPDWAVGRPINVDGKLLVIVTKRRHVWPKWWHKLGRQLGWRWLENYRTLGSMSHVR